MKILIIFASYFGNTEKIAAEIAAGFGPEHDVRVIKAEEFQLDQLRDIKLLIVGSPTRAFRPAPILSICLKAIPKNGLAGIQVTAFDTRIALENIKSGLLRSLVKIMGYAANPLAKTLVKKGGILAAPPLGFHVQDTEGPLTKGEAEKAAGWAVTILAGILSQ
ncbi:MAG: flavodoxin family protein [Candidatus Cloacimonetes bacterium]|nr:flavodoxin family protein [Candidatus Cloacimonadota bacterium]